MASFSGLRVPPPGKRDGSRAARSRLQPALCSKNVFQDDVERAADTPIWIMRAELRQVGDVADVIALAVLLDILPVQFFSIHLLNFGNSFKHRDAVLTAPAEVVDLAATRIGSEFLHGTYDIVTMNIIADLLALVTEDG